MIYSRQTHFACLFVYLKGYNETTKLCLFVNQSVTNKQTKFRLFAYLITKALQTNEQKSCIAIAL